MATLFQTKVVKFIPRLMRDVSCDLETACAIFGNIGHECNGFQTMQEIGVTPPKGGWGWQQWTGPRRTAFMDWAFKRKLDPAGDEANYGFMVYELLGTEKASLAATKKAVGLNDKTDTFERTNERAGVPALASRRKYAKIALDAYNASLAAPKPAPSPPPPDTPAEPPAAIPEPPSPAPKGGVSIPAATTGAVVSGGIAASGGSNWFWVIAGVLVVAALILFLRKRG
jgi:hypothetical protein